MNEIPERTATTKQTIFNHKDTLQKIPRCNTGMLYAGYSGEEIQQANLEFTVCFHLGLQLQLLLLYYLKLWQIQLSLLPCITMQLYKELGKIREQGACIPVKTGERCLM